jgi:cation diffusion facilitator family transporter
MSRARVDRAENFWDSLARGDSRSGRLCQRSAICQRVLFINLWLTIVSLAVRVWMGWSTQSLSLLADSLHTIVDAFSALLSLTALTSPYRYQGRETWSHGKLEAMMILGLAGTIGFGALSLMMLVIHQLMMTPSLAALPPVTITDSMIQMLTLMTIAQAAGYCFQYRVGRQVQSVALKVNALNYLQDAWIGVVLIGALLLISWGYRWIDSMLALGMVLMAVASGWRVVCRQVPTLLQQVAIAPEALIQIAQQVQGVTSCDAVQSRGVVGRQVWVEMDVVLHPEFMSSQNWVKQQIEAMIRDRYGPVQVMTTVMVHNEGFEGRSDS